MVYLRPVPFTRSTSWGTHKRRNPPSSEPGIDMFCPIGTPVLAIGSGRIADTGDSITPATGRFVTLDLDDGRRARFLHLSRRVVSVGTRVNRGQVIGYSGASGYGEEDWSWNVAETGGAHVHMTLWPSQRYVFGALGTLDPDIYLDPAGSVASTDATPFEEDTMYENDPGLQARLNQIVDYLDANFKGLTGKVGGEGDQTRRHIDVRISDLAGWTRDDANGIRQALSGLSVAGTDPKKIAEAIAPLIPAGASAKDVADELGRRLGVN